MLQPVQKFLLCMAFVFIALTIHAQPNITRVEYYVDNDPGYGKGKNIPVPMQANVPNASFDVSTDTLKPGVHIIGIRAKDSKGAWSLDNKWLFIIPPKIITLPKLNYVEYYIDNDPGYGKAKKYNFSADTNLSGKPIQISTDTLKPGVHLFCIRAKDAKGAWSLDNKWLFIIPPKTIALPKLNYVEYYIDNDPGYGKAKKYNFSADTNLLNKPIQVNTDTLKPGVHLFCIRARDGKGAWSLDNKWLFIIQKPATARPDLKEVEYYIDTDPGYGKGTPLAFNATKDIKNFELPVNVSALDTGMHVFFIRSKDSKGAWSLDNIDTFYIPSVLKPATIVVNSIASAEVCAGGNIKISYQANGTYKSGNVFKVELSNKSGSFGNPTVIGTRNGKEDAIINCIIPKNVLAGSNYRVRVVSTNPVITGLASDSSFIINALPAKPVISSVPVNTTDLCPDTTATLTSSAATKYLWNTGASSQTIVADSTGTYFVKVTNAKGCSNISDTVVVSYSACEKPVSLKTTNITATSARLSWKDEACAAKYRIQYRVSGTTAFTTVNRPDSFYVVSGLMPGTAYEWRVQTLCNAAGTIKSAYTKLLGFTTDSTVASSIAASKDELQKSADLLDALIVPNPVLNSAQLRITTTNAIVSVYLSDATGKLLWKVEHTTEKKIALPSETISNGIYFIKVTDGVRSKTIRLVKQK